jgi:hypothetical protein
MREPEFTTVRIRKDTMEKYRQHCDQNRVAIGRSIECLLEEAIEDDYFSRRADAALVRAIGRPTVSHEELMSMCDEAGI